MELNTFQGEFNTTTPPPPCKFASAKLHKLVSEILQILYGIGTLGEKFKHIYL